MRPQFVQTAIEKIKTTTEGLFNIKFKPFDKKTSHHWCTLMSWFQREVLFLEAESGKIIEETFDYLIKSDVAAKKLKYLKTLPLREKIKLKYMRKVNSIISKFGQEIDKAQETFDEHHENPPIAENLPPISGSIFWSQGISLSLKTTQTELESLKEVTDFPPWKEVKSKLVTVLKNLESYEVNKYNDWSNKVSNILEVNLGRNLIKVDKVEEGCNTFIVNFTSVLSDTFAEVLNMEKIGFKVPEVAKNMSMQESKLIDISEQLDKMLEHYHKVINSVEGADKQLLLENLKETEKALRPGLVRLTWNSLGIPDYITQSEIAICRTESVIRQILSIKENIEGKVNLIKSSKLFRKFLKRNPAGLENFEEFHKTILSYEGLQLEKLVGHYQDICPLLMKVEELLVNSRTKSHPRMKNYFAYWEGIIYKALMVMVKQNLDDLLLLLESKKTLFKIEVRLVNGNVVISPSEQMILKGIIMILKTLLDGTKMFIRWGNGTCIPMEKARVKGEIRPIQPSFFEDIVRIPEIIEKVDLVQNSTVKSLEEIQLYLSSWKKYKNLWKYDKKSTCNKFLERLPSCVDFDAKLLYYSLLERQIEDREFTSNFKCIELSLRPIKKTLLNETHEWINCLGKLLEKTAKEELANLQATLDALNKCLIYPKNGSELEKSLQAISSIWKMSLSVEMSYKEIEEKYRTLNMYGINIEKSQIFAAQNLPKVWEAIFHKSKEVHFRVSPMKEKYTEITKLLIKRFLKEVEDLYSVFKKSGPSSVGSDLDKGLELLHTFKIEFVSTCDKAKSLNDQEKLYVLPITNFKVLQALKKDLETLEEIYNLYKRYSKYEAKWKKLTWKILDLDISEKDCNKIDADLSLLCVQFSNQAPLSEIQLKIDHSKHLFKILRKLKESKLRSRHWREIEKVTNVKIDEDINFKIETFWSFDLKELEEKFVGIIEKASHERNIESELQEIKEIWESLKFLVTRESWHEDGESHYLLGDVSQIFDNLLNHQALLDQMMKSSYSQHFMKDIEFWKSNLTTIEKSVDEWTNVQEIWMKISKALSIKGFRDNVQDVVTFDDISKRYVRIMVETAKKPTVKDICLSSGFISTMELIRKELEEFKTLLNDAFELKRKQFPRFFFLSDDELISVLGGNVRDSNIQRLIMGLFQQLSEFCPDKDGNIEVLFTKDEEDLPLIKSVNTEKQPIEAWLSNLTEEMKISMKLMARLALKNCQLEKESFFEDLKEFPVVLAVAIFDKLWNDEFVKAFETHQAANDDFKILEEWRRLYMFCNELLQKLMDKKDLTGVEYKRNCLYIKMVLSKKDLIDSFLNTCLSSESDFNWEKIMKYYWNDEIFALEIRQGNHGIDYGYEFMGVDNFAVHNPESDRVWFLINETIKNHNIPYLSGPTGIGKTAIIEDLGMKLGRAWRSIALSEMFTIDSVNRYMRGICESNFWGIMENINILKMSVMSVISSHFQTIKTAQTLHLREFSLSGKLTSMSPKVVFVCTENEVHGAKSLKAIPLSLKIVFRKVSVQLPNMEKLFSIVMRVKGIKYPVTMSKQLATSERTISRVLNLPFESKLSLFNRMINQAIQMSKDCMEVPENQVFFNIMKEYYRNILPNDQFEIASAILKDQFKIEKEILIDDTSEARIKELNMCEGLTKNQQKDVLNSLDMLKWTNSLIVFGPPYSGKSKIINSVAKLLPDELPYFYLDPSSYDQAILLGSGDDHGIFSGFLNRNDGSFLLHLDGACDEKVALPISQILDKEEFFSGNGRRFYSNAKKKLIIETSDLSKISNAIRCRSLVVRVCHDTSDLPHAIIADKIKEMDLGPDDSKLLIDQSLALQQSLESIGQSEVDRFAARNSLKKLSETMDLFQSLINKKQDSTLSELLLFSFQFVFTSCEVKQQRADFLNALKSCLNSHKDKFALTTLREKLPEISHETSFSSNVLNQAINLGRILLQNQKPVLIIGQRCAEEVFEAIVKGYKNANTYNCSIKYHALSDEMSMLSDIKTKYLRRGKDILVPKGYRNVLISATDLHDPLGDTDSQPISLLKDIVDKKVLVFDENLCNITEINSICKISPRTKCFKQSNIFNKFICIFVEENDDDTFQLYRDKISLKYGKEIEDDLTRIISVSKELINTFQTKYSSLSTVITPKTIFNLLDKLSEQGTVDDLITELVENVYAALVSPILDADQKHLAMDWISTCLNKFGIPFKETFEEVHESIELDQIVLNKQQTQQMKEICRFLNHKRKFLSLYGEFGYGKTMVLESATKTCNFNISFARSAQEFKSLQESTENNLIVVRDCYITDDNIKRWLAILSSDNPKKVAFLMSKKNTLPVYWLQWILSYSQTIGFTFWDKFSLLHAVKESSIEPKLKEALVDIHQQIIKCGENLPETELSMHVTSVDFLSFVKGVEQKFSQEMEANSQHKKELSSIITWLKKRKEFLNDTQVQLTQNETKLENCKAEMKSAKKELKSLEDDKLRLTTEFQEESLCNKEMKEKENQLCEKYESIKSSSFVIFEKAVKDIEGVGKDEIIAFSKPMLVHEDIEKVINILMLLLHSEISGWKPFKEKFLSKDWQIAMAEFEPDSCKHKQQFIINKRFKEIKTKRDDLGKISPMSGLFWNYIEGAFTAFNTKFERDKFRKEIDEVQLAIIESEKKLKQLKSDIEKLDNNIKKNEHKFQELGSSCVSLEASIVTTKTTLQIEKKFTSESQDLYDATQTELIATEKDTMELMSNIVMEKVVCTYLGKFKSSERKGILRGAMESIKEYREPSSDPSTLLEKLDITKFGPDICQHLKLLTDRRLVFCYDPNNIIKILFRDESMYEGIKVTELADIDKIYDLVKSKNHTSIVIEDAYFENASVMNILLDEELNKLCQRTSQEDIFLFILTKTQSCNLPHRAYSSVFYLNLDPNEEDVINLMKSELNRYSQQTLESKLINLQTIKFNIVSKISECKANFSKKTSDKVEVMTDEIIQNLVDLKRRKLDLSQTEDEMNDVSNELRNTVSELAKTAAPILYGLFMLSKCKLAPKPSIFSYLKSAIAMAQSKESEDPMLDIFTRYSFQISERGRVLLSTFISVALMNINQEINNQEMKMFQNILLDLETARRSQQNIDIEAMLEKYALNNYTKYTETKGWTVSLSHEEDSNKMKYMTLLANIIINHTRINTFLISFVKQTISDKYLQSSTIYVSDVHGYSSPYNPIVFLLENSVEEPSSDLTKLADLQGIASSKVKYLALSEDNIVLAMDLLETAFIRGQWIIFQNVNIVPSFLPTLEKRINEKDKDDIHGDFRVWMTWCSSEFPAFTLLQKSIGKFVKNVVMSMKCSLLIMSCLFAKLPISTSFTLLAGEI